MIIRSKVARSSCGCKRDNDQTESFLEKIFHSWGRKQDAGQGHMCAGRKNRPWVYVDVWKKKTEKVAILVPSPAEMCTMQIACRYKVNRTGQNVGVVTVEHFPDLSSSTSTQAIAQHHVGFYERDSLVYIVVLSEVPEYSFCSWG